MKYTLFEDQEKLKRKIAVSLQKNDKVLAHAPTGFGKTILSRVIIDTLTSKGNRVLFTVPRIKLAVQTRDKFGYGNLILGAKTKNYNSLLTIASVQSLLSRKVKDSFDYIFIDECHYSHGSKYINYIFDTYKDSKIIGLSATPLDENGYLLQGYDEIVTEVSVSDLIKMNRLCDVDVYTSIKQPELKDIPVTNGDYNQTKASEVLRESEVLSNIIDEWIDKAGDLKTLVFATDINHSEIMKVEFEKLNVKCGVVHSQMKERDIERAYASFSEDNIQVLINVDMATFGFDEPSIECLLFARPIKSLRLYKQMVGRGLRVHKGKDKCIMLDCANVVVDNGYPTDNMQFIKKPVVSEKLDNLFNIEREDSGEIKTVLTKERRDYLTKISSLFDLYSQREYRLEKDFQEDVRTFLKRAGFFIWRQNSGTLYVEGRYVHFTDIKGLPDLTIIYKGVYIGIELKMKKGVFSKHQKITLPNMINSGCYVFVVDNFMELFRITELIKNSILDTTGGVIIKSSINELTENQKKYRKKLGL